MSPLVWSEEQQLLRETARAFLDAHAPVDALRQLRDAGDADGFSRPLWHEMSRLGWAGIPFAERYGGAGLGWSEVGVLMRECGRTLAATPMLASCGQGGSLVELAGSEAQREAWLPALCAGEALWSAALQEGPHHAPTRVHTRARRVRGGWRLRGSKHFALDAHAADFVVVVARTAGEPESPDGLGLFVVERDAPGFRAERRCYVDGRGAADLVLDDVDVADDAVLGEADGGVPALERTIDRSTAMLCAEMLGGLESAFERTLAYLGVRRQFGVPIGSFQALQHRAALMFIEQELCRSVVLEALHALDGGRDDAAACVSVAKAQLDDAVRLIGNEAVQMHGGIGVTDEADIGLFLKRFRVQERTLGDARYHRDRFAQLGGY